MYFLILYTTVTFKIIGGLKNAVLSVAAVLLVYCTDQPEDTECEASFGIRKISSNFVPICIG